MTDQVVGRGIIELVADARKVRAGIEEAKRSIKSLGEGQRDASSAASQSIDRYVAKLNQQAATIGKSARETDLYKLALRGATDAQIKSADSALRIVEQHEKLASLTSAVRTGLIAAAAAATALATGYGAAVLGSIDLADKLKDLSKSTGISVEDLSGLRLLAKQTGTDLDGLAKGINKMSVELGKDPEAFRALGVTAKDSLGAFKQLADIFNVLPDLTQRNALAQKVFSKSWQELAPALSEGSRGITEAIEKGTRLSGITKEMADRADEFNDRLAELKVAGSSFGLNLLPTLTEIVTQLSAATVATGSLVKGMSALASLKVGNFGSTISEQLKEIEAAQARSDTVRRLTPGAFLTQGVLDIRDAALADMKKTVQALQREQALALPGGDSPGEKIRAGQSLAQRVGPSAADAAARAAAFLKDKSIASAARDTARQEAQAQLAFDLEQIRKASDATIGAFSNSERIMEAMRAAALVDDKDYFASKLGFIQLNARQQEAALQQEIERLQRETFAGADAAKDRINNERKIADAQAKIAKVRADAFAQGQVNSIQQAAADTADVLRLKAKEDAQLDYLEALRQTNIVALQSASIGDATASRLQERLQIEQKYNDQVRDLSRARSQAELITGTLSPDAQKKYDEELALIRRFQSAALADYDNYSSERLRMEQDWTVGASKALANYYEESRNVAKQTEQVFTNAFRGLEDALVEFANTGKLSFKSLASSILSDLNRISVRQNITAPLAKFLEAGISGLGASIGGLTGAQKDVAAALSYIGFDNIPGRAEGGLVRQGAPYVVGERGPELFIPRSSGAIVPNGAGGGITLNQHFTIGNNTDSRSQEHLAAAAYRGAKRAFERGTA